MQRNRIVVTLVGYVVLVALGVPWGELGGLASYILVALVCVGANVKTSQADLRFRWPFRLIAAFVGAFVVARALEAASFPSAAVEVAYQVSYVVVLATVVVMVRMRVQRFELSAFLESTLVSAGVLLVILQIQLVPSLESDGFVIVAILLTTFLMSMTFLGRSSAGPAWPLWFMTVLLSVAIEIAYGFRETSALAAFLSTHAASLSFVPLTLVTVFDRPIRQTTNDELLVRRPIGRRQLAVTFFLLVLSPAVLIPMVSANDERQATASWVGLCALVITAAVVWRFDLLVRDRDRSFASEERLRELSERIVSVGGRDEAFRAISSTVRELVGADTPVAFVAVSATNQTEVHALVDDGFRSIGQADDAAAALRLLEESQNSPMEDHEPSDFSEAVTGELILPYNQRERSELRGNLRTVEAILQLTLETLDARERSHQERADRRFRALVQDSNDIVMVVDGESGRTKYVGPTVVRLLGREPSEYEGADPLQHLHHGDREAVQAAIGTDHGALEPLDVRVQTSEGDYRWFALSVRDLADESELEGLLYSFADINDRKMAELQLLSSEGRYRTLVKNAKDVFALIDADSRITFVSPNVGSLLGYSPNDLIGTNVRGLLSERGAAALEDVMRRNDSDLLGRTVEVELQTASDEARIVEVVFSDPGLDDEAETLVTVHDITEQKRLEESLRQQTLYDPLTGLYNRASIYPELARGLQGLASTDTIAVLHINVVDFRHLNESVGFGEGDRLLIEIGSRLRSVLRSEDSIARFNADEFAVVTSGPTLSSIFDLGSRLLASFDEPFVVDDRQIEIRAVLGLDASSDRRQNATTLIENAALAMRASRDNDQPITVFEESMRIEATERFELVSDFRNAVDEEQFSLVFQPLFDLDQNKVSSVEALLRWNHPERGLISPAVFIPLAEESGFIIDLGQWVLRRACEQLAAWHRDLPNGRGLSMSVNVSARQLETTGSGQALLDTIEASGVDKSSLTLELTETVLIADAEWLRHELQLFRDLGIKIAVDDFGAGAAGLNHLRDVPFDVLKVDKSYIDNIEYSEESYNLVAGVIELAHGMKTKLVAEGIETPKQASLLRQMGCDYGQGFYLARPMATNRLEEWFALGRDGSVAAAISDAR